MKIIDVEQGTKEWFKARAGIPTASDFSKIITSTGKRSSQITTYAYQLASEVISELDDNYKSIDMERGNELEYDAVQEYREYTFNHVEHKGFLKTDNGNAGYSPDGLIGNDGILEIKCPMQKTHTKYLAKNELPPDYVAQVQGGLFVSERKWCDFVSYNPKHNGDMRLFIKRIERDEVFIQALSEGLENIILMRNKHIKDIKIRYKTKTIGVKK